MLKRIKVFGRVVLEIETDESHDGAPDFVSTPHPIGFVHTTIIPHKPGEEE